MLATGLQVFDLAFQQRFVNLPELAVPGLEGPLFVGVEVSESDVVDHDILD